MSFYNMIQVKGNVVGYNDIPYIRLNFWSRTSCVKMLLKLRHSSSKLVIKLITWVNERVCETLSLLIRQQRWARGGVPTSVRFLSSVWRLLSRAAATLPAFDAFPLIYYLHSARTIPSPIMHRFSINRVLPFDQINSFCGLSLRSSAGPSAVLVWRHDGHRAAGPDPSVGGPQQRRGRLQSATEPEEQVAGGGSGLISRPTGASPRCDSPASPAPVLQPGLAVPFQPKGLSVLVPLIIKSRDNKLYGVLPSQRCWTLCTGLLLTDDYISVHTICF